MSTIKAGKMCLFACVSLACELLFFLCVCVLAGDLSEDFAMRSTPSTPAIQSSDVIGSTQGLHQGAGGLEEALFENVKEVCLQPQTGSQHNKVTLAVNLSNVLSS